MDEAAQLRTAGRPLLPRRIHAAGADAAIAYRNKAVVYDLLCEQQSLDSVDVRSPLADQPAPLTMRAPQILLVDTWNARTSDQTCRSPRHQAISVRSSILTSTRSVLTRRARRLTWRLPGSITRHSMPRALRNRANQNAS